MASPTNIATDRIGDWMLLPTGTVPPIAARFQAPWNKIFETPDLSLWASPPADQWKGWPVQHAEDDHFHAWLIGDLAADSPCIGEVLHQPSAAARLNGYFIALAYEKASHRWHVITNRFGTVHAYHAPRSSRTGSYYPAVAAGASELDWQGLAGFFRMGFFPGTRTYFKDVGILPMASWITLDAEGKIDKVQRYWHWHHDPQPRPSLQQTAEAFGEIFHQVMDEATDEGRIALPISGGLDSRSTVVAMARPARRDAVQSRTWSYSYGYTDDSVETRISRRIARTAGFPFEAFTIQPYLFDRLTDILEWTEGFQDITQCRQTFVRDHIAQKADVLIGGLWGDVWHDQMGLLDRPPMANAELAPLILKKMEKRGHPWLISHLISPNLGSDGRAPLLEHIHDVLDRLDDIKEPDFKVKAFKTEEWSFRWSIPPVRVFHSAALPRLVFYDTRLTDFFLTVPTREVADRQMQIEYIKRFSPQLARITWQVYDANLYWYRYFNTLLLPKRAWKKFRRIVRGEKVIQRNWEVQFLSSEREKQQLKDHLLSPGLRLHHYVERNVIETLLHRFLTMPAPDGAIGYTVSMLLSFAAWLEWLKAK